MPERKLEQIADELKGQLEGVDDLDEDAREALQEAAAAIHGALESDEPTESLLEGVRERIQRFEGAHPTLTEVVRRLIDQLADMGI